LKRILVAALAAVAVTPSLAADISIKAPPVRPVPAWSWTGFYLGGNVGGGWAKSDWFEDAASSGSGGAGAPGFQDASVHASGILGGGQIGFDYQNGWAVFGIQADAAAAGIRGDSRCFPEVVGMVQTCPTKIDAMGTVTGRIGAAFDRTLFYVLGGFAWEHERLDNLCNICTSLDSRFSGTKWGWTVGAGLEYALAGNWSAFVQYNYMGFGTRNQFLRSINPPGGRSETEVVRDNINVIKTGINYRFNWGPVTTDR
jgi:outer membrane immunogenic protein